MNYLLIVLQFEFGEIVSRDSYIAAEERTAILFRHIADFLSESHQSKVDSERDDIFIFLARLRL